MLISELAIVLSAECTYCALKGQEVAHVDINANQTKKTRLRNLDKLISALVWRDGNVVLGGNVRWHKSTANVVNALSRWSEYVFRISHVNAAP